MTFPRPFTWAALATLVAFPLALPSGATAGPLRSSAPPFVSLAAPSQIVNFGVHLPLRNQAQLEALVNVQSNPHSPMYRHWLTPAQFRTQFGPSPAVVAAAVGSLRSEGFAVDKVETQLIHVHGTAAVTERAFGVHLGNVRDSDGTMRLAPREQLTVPAALTAANATVIGLAYTQKPRPQSRIVPMNRYSATGPYWFDDLKQAYDYPAYGLLNGKGVSIGTVGYSDFSSSDAALYFNHERVGGPTQIAPMPEIKHVVFPGSEKFNPNYGTSDEANLDVQMAAGSAPGATVYGFAAPTYGEGFLFVYSYIVDNNAVDIVTTSYGECELFYTPAYNNGASYVPILKSYHDLFLQGNAQGITFLFSSGDDSARSCPEPGYLGDPGQGKVYKDVPGTSIWSDDPDVTSVGGTNLQTVPNPNPTASPLQITSAAYLSENANADIVEGLYDPYGVGNFISNGLWGSGGGPSVIFTAPPYQTNVNTGSTMRTDPDISMHMGGCPYYISPITGNPVAEKCGKGDSADVAAIGGKLYLLIGTSASSPEFAGLLAVREEGLADGRMGNANFYIYDLAAYSPYVYHQGIPGFNGVVQTHAQPGYNQVVGNGTPDALKFIGSYSGMPAGDPQTKSNP